MAERLRRRPNTSRGRRAKETTPPPPFLYMSLVQEFRESARARQKSPPEHPAAHLWASISPLVSFKCVASYIRESARARGKSRHRSTPLLTSGSATAPRLLLTISSVLYFSCGVVSCVSPNFGQYKFFFLDGLSLFSHIP